MNRDFRKVLERALTFAGLCFLVLSSVFGVIFFAIQIIDFLFKINMIAGLFATITVVFTLIAFLAVLENEGY